MGAETSAADLDRAVSALLAADVFAFDTETTGFDAHRNAIKGISLSVGPGEDETWWFPFKGDGAVSQVRTFRALAPVFSDKRKTLVGSNIKFDVKFVAVHHPEILVRNRFADTVVAHWLIDENSQHGLKHLAKRYLGVEMASYKEASAMEGGLFGNIFSDYAKEDARQVLRLWREALAPELERQGLSKLFHEVEMPLVRTLIEMEVRGVAVDLDFLSDLERRMRAQRDEARAEALKAAGREFDVGSPQEVSKLLFGDYGLKPFEWMKKGKAGYYSTDDSVLERYDGDPLVAAVLKHRSAAQTLSIYCAPYAERTKEEPRIRAEFNQPGTVRGRMSSSNPNLQQVAPGVKPLFVASPGKRMVGGDFNQLQFRLVGHFAEDVLGRSKVAEAYRAGMDLHTKTQQEMGLKERKPAKCVTGDTLLLTDAGLLRIDEIVEPVAEGEVRPYEGEPLRVVADRGLREIQEVYYGGRQPVYRLVGQHGFSVTATANHRFVVLRGGAPERVPLRDIRPGDSVLLKIGARTFGRETTLPRISLPPRTSHKPVETPEALTPEAARWLGYYVAEGSRGHYGTSYVVSVGMNAGDAVEDVQRCWDAVAPGRVSRREYGGVVRLACHSRDFYEWVGALGCGDGADHKRVPDVVRRAPQEAQAEFLRGLFEGDGSVTVDPNRCVSLASNSSELISVVHVMLLNLGVLARRDKVGESHRLMMSGAEAARFAEAVGFVGLEKSGRLAQVAASRRSTRFYPFSQETVGRLLETSSGDLKERVRHCLKGVRFGETLLRDIPAADWTDEMRWAAEAGVVGEEVISVEHVGEQDVYDVVAPPEKLFVTNGFLTEDTINFAFIFGRGAKSFAHANRRSMEEARAYYDGFHRAYPEIRQMADYCRREITRRGCVTSFAGRRIHFPDMLNRQITGEREDPTYWPGWVAWNGLVQAGESDLVRIVMRNIQRRIDAKRVEDPRWFEVYLQLQVHDELVGEAPDDLADEFAAIMKHEAEHSIDGLLVPIVFEVKVGDSWADVKG